MSFRCTRNNEHFEHTFFFFLFSLFLSFFFKLTTTHGDLFFLHKKLTTTHGVSFLLAKKTNRMDMDGMFPEIAASKNKGDLYDYAYQNFYNMGFSLMLMNIIYLPTVSRGNNESMGRLSLVSSIMWSVFAITSYSDSQNDAMSAKMKEGTTANLVIFGLFAVGGFVGFLTSGAKSPGSWVKADDMRAPRNYPAKSPPWYWVMRWNMLLLVFYAGMFILMGDKMMVDYNMPTEMQDTTTALGFFSKMMFKNIGLNFFFGACSMAAILSAHDGITIFRVSTSIAMWCMVSIASASQAKMFARSKGQDTSPWNVQIFVGIVSCLLYSFFVVKPYMWMFMFVAKEAAGIDQMRTSDDAMDKETRAKWDKLFDRMKAHQQKLKSA